MHWEFGAETHHDACSDGCVRSRRTILATDCGEALVSTLVVVIICIVLNVGVAITAVHLSNESDNQFAHIALLFVLFIFITALTIFSGVVLLAW